MATSVHPTPKFNVKKVVLAHQDTLRAFKNSSDARYATVSRVGKYLYVTGRVRKRMANSGTMFSIVAILDIHLQQWRWVETEDCTIQLGSIMFLFEDALYLYGSNDWMSTNTGNVSRFDLTLEEWSVYYLTNTARVNRNGFTADFVERRNRLVVFGGRANARDSNLLDVFAVHERLWARPVIKGMPPSPRRQHGSCVEGDVIYYHGGYTGDSESNPGLYRLEIAQGDILTWSQVRTDTSVLGSLSSFAVVSLGRMLLFCGGYRKGRTHVLTVYDQKEREFTTISLSDEDSKGFGGGARAFPTNGGRSIGLFGGTGRFDSYVEITPTV